MIWIKDALSKGMDGVFLMGCKHGDDYQCHFVKGSELAEIRVKKIGEALSSLALELERVAQFQVAIDEYDKAPQMHPGVRRRPSRGSARTRSRGSNAATTNRGRAGSRPPRCHTGGIRHDATTRD
ncbi:MAG: hydrogenase iron-sulfur subunit [Desulfobacterales bacterium]|nr:hydrogenase iron-sulfur subunit [Desulfobacterales bacterium]